MQFSYHRTVFALSAFVSALGMMACGQLLDLDTYTKADPSSGGSGGMGSGGEDGGGGAPTECTPNTTADCYEGPAKTGGVGLCKVGLKTCNADGTYGACLGQVFPTIENCALADDEDCNGASAGCTGVADWSKSYGTSAGQQFGSFVRAMSDGSVVVFGEFSDTIDFGCAEPLKGILGSTDIFLLKLDPKGECAFARQFGTASLSDYAYGLAIDANDNILITGGYTAAGIDFDGGAFTHAGSNDIYLAKFDKEGTHIWSKHYGDQGDQLAQSVNTDAQGNIYVSGDFNGTIDFGNGMMVTAQMNEKKGFLAKLSPSGQPIYVDSFGVTVNLTEAVLDTRAAVDDKGNVAVIGRFTGTFNSGAGMVTSQPTGFDIFLLRYDTMGKPISVKRFGGESDDHSYRIAVGPQGDVYVAGRTTGMQFDVSQFGQANPTISGNGDVVLMKLLPNGQLDQVKLFGDLEEQTVTGLAVDVVGHVVLGGNFTGQIDFGGGSLGTAMKNTLFLAKFDADLKHLLSRPYYSSAAETTLRVGTDPQTNILFTGYFFGGLLIKDNEPLTNAGNSDIFVAKLAP